MCHYIKILIVKLNHLQENTSRHGQGDFSKCTHPGSANELMASVLLKIVRRIDK